MIFRKTNLKDVFVIEVEKHQDDRGFFGRIYDKKIFEEMKITSEIVQSNVSFNTTKGTIRGLHFQKEPFQEGKLVLCTKGSVFEVMIDLREESPTYLEKDYLHLNSKEHKLLYVPKGFALGFQTLEDNTELFYQMTEKYIPEYASGIRWNDPKFEIKWPLEPTIISEKDRMIELFK